MFKARILILTLFVLSLLAGCKAQGTKTTSSAITTTSTSTTITSPIVLSSSAPNNIPVFPDAELVSVPPSFDTEWGISMLHSQVYNTTAELNQIFDWYRHNLVGWTMEKEGTYKGGSTFQKYSKNTDGVLILFTGSSNGKSALLVTATGSWEQVQAIASTP